MAYVSNKPHNDELWSEILDRHWRYVEAEESMAKIKLRRNLEDLIAQRLGKVPPSEKFYLADTRCTFDSSVAHLDDFSAYKASIGFEAISQYANNLFVKPWRKEYKVIKTYSGFYQHEIAANLVNAEKLFLAMGYQLMPNKTLILDGPICPDQVMNVARDAITAYVECQLMKRIYNELISLEESFDWVDIYNFRSSHTGDVTQTVKQMQFSARHNKQQDTYGNNSASALAPASSCNSCNPYQFHIQNQQPSSVPLAQHSASAYCGGNGVVVGSSQLYNSAVAVAPCSIHSQQQHHQQQQPPPPQQQVPASAYGGAYHPHHLPSHHHHHHLHHSSYSNFQPTTTPSSAAQQQQQQQVGAPTLGAMPHSKSLDHYQAGNSAAAAAAAAASASGMYGMNMPCAATMYMQRHSIDHPYHYTMATPYGGHQAAVSSALTGGPPSFEGQLDGLLSCGVAGGGGGGGPGEGGGVGVSCGSNNHPYTNVPGRYPAMSYAGNANFSMGIPPVPMFVNGGGGAVSVSGGMKQHPNGMVEGCGSYPYPAMNLGYSSYRGSNGMMPASYCHPPDSSVYGGSSMVAAPNHTSGYGTAPQPGASILSNMKKSYDEYDVISSMRRATDTVRSGGGGCAKKLDRYHKNSELLIDYESDMLPEALAERNQKEQQHHHHHHYLHHQTSRNSRQSDFDSYEDEQQQREQEEQNSSVSRRISNKNQDGIGCYESWNYVYQNLEKQGYTKDLGERDFLADEIDGEDNRYGMDGEDELRRRRRNEMNDHEMRQSGRRESAGTTLRRNEKLKAMKAKAADKVDGIARQTPIAVSSSKQHASDIRRHERQSSAPGVPAMSATMLHKKVAKMALTNSPGETVADPEHNVADKNGSANGRKSSVTKKQITPQGSGSSSSTAAAVSAKETKTNSPGILVNNHYGSNSTGTAYTASNSTATTQVKKKTATFDTGAATIINPSPTGSSPGADASQHGGEWNCNYCTYLNPDVKRICDMCSKSRDFGLEGTKATSNGTTATCV